MGKDYPTPPGIAKLPADADDYLSLWPEAPAEPFAQDVPARQAAIIEANASKPCKAQNAPARLSRPARPLQPYCASGAGGESLVTAVQAMLATA